MTYKPKRTFIGEYGHKSIEYEGPEALKDDFDNIVAMFDPDAAHEDESQGGIGEGNLNFSIENHPFVKGKITYESDSIKYMKTDANGLTFGSPDGTTWTEIGKESERQANESQREINELNRRVAETTRKGNETLRKNEELVRIHLENTRNTNESNRTLAEQSRIQVELVRVGNESIRVSREATRVSAEDIRIANENLRMNEVEGATGKIKTKADEVVQNTAITLTAKDEVVGLIGTIYSFRQSPKLSQLSKSTIIPTPSLADIANSQIGGIL